MTAPTEIAELERLVDVALKARVPGGSEVWVWLPQQDAFTPSETARDVMRCAIKAALEARSDGWREGGYDEQTLAEGSRRLNEFNAARKAKP